MTYGCHDTDESLCPRHYQQQTQHFGVDVEHWGGGWDESRASERKIEFYMRLKTEGMGE